MLPLLILAPTQKDFFCPRKHRKQECQYNPEFPIFANQYGNQSLSIRPTAERRSESFEADSPLPGFAARAKRGAVRNKTARNSVRREGTGNKKFSKSGKYW